MSEPTYAGHPIVGTWRLISFTEQNLDTGAASYPFGEEAKALVIYEINGYVATIFTRVWLNQFTCASNMAGSVGAAGKRSSPYEEEPLMNVGEHG